MTARTHWGTSPPAEPPCTGADQPVHQAGLAAFLAAAIALVLASCARTAEPAAERLQGEPSSAEYVALQTSDVPPGLVRCSYSAPIATYIENVGRLKPEASASVGSTWTTLQEAGAVEGFIAVYGETPAGCTQWITGADGSYVSGGSRLVSAVVVRFEGSSAAEAAFRADIFKQSSLASQQGARVLTGPAAGLGPNAVVGAIEGSLPSVHQAVWQRAGFIVYLTSRNLTRAEFTTATASADQRAA